mmetsp:Transcript_17645/g.40691  ORF Transcript_17645/g.40691 Transcript_17645/m.40691 type:complete len:274 (+) Transcript_17645:35-856(+)
MLLFPKTSSVFIDWWAILARNFTGLVFVVTSYDWFRNTAIQSFATTIIFLLIPFRHLLIVKLLVVLILGPAHVEYEWFDFAVNHSSHVVLGLVIFRAAREQRVSKFAPDLHSQPFPTHKFCYLRCQCSLMTFSLGDEVALFQEAVEEICSQAIIANKIKAGVWRIWLVSNLAGTIVLENHIPLGRFFRLEIFERVFVPYDIDVLEQNIVSESQNKMNAVNLCHHHHAENFVSIPLGCLFGHASENSLIVKDRNPEFLRQIDRVFIRSKHDNTA